MLEDRSKKEKSTRERDAETSRSSGYFMPINPSHSGTNDPSWLLKPGFGQLATNQHQKSSFGSRETIKEDRRSKSRESQGIQSNDNSATRVSRNKKEKKNSIPSFDTKDILKVKASIYH